MEIEQKIRSKESVPGEWMSTQQRLARAAFRNRDKETLLAVEQNITEIFGSHIAMSFLVDEFKDFKEDDNSSS